MVTLSDVRATTTLGLIAGGRCRRRRGARPAGSSGCWCCRKWIACTAGAGGRRGRVSPGRRTGAARHARRGADEARALGIDRAWLSGGCATISGSRPTPSSGLPDRSTYQRGARELLSRAHRRVVRDQARAEQRRGARAGPRTRDGGTAPRGRRPTGRTASTAGDHRAPRARRPCPTRLRRRATARSAGRQYRRTARRSAAGARANRVPRSSNARPAFPYAGHRSRSATAWPSASARAPRSQAGRAIRCGRAGPCRAGRRHASRAPGGGAASLPASPASRPRSAWDARTDRRRRTRRAARGPRPGRPAHAVARRIHDALRGRRRLGPEPTSTHRQGASGSVRAQRLGRDRGSPFGFEPSDADTEHIVGRDAVLLVDARDLRRPHRPVCRRRRRRRRSE